MDASELSRALSWRAEEIARMLLPDGKKASGYWKAGNVQGDRGDSLAIHLSGDKAGKWTDYATGEHGDLIDLWIARRGVDLLGALDDIRSYLGVPVQPHFHGSKPRKYSKPKKPQARKPVSVLDYLVTERKLSIETVTAYQVAEISQSTGLLIVFPFKRNDELLNVKYSPLDREEDGSKKPSWFEKGCEMLLWGWQTIKPTDRAVVITEGEIDAMTWHDYGVAALSLPNGCKGMTWIENEFDNLERFEIIYLSLDMDPSGQDSIAEVVDRLGRHRCHIVKLPRKDANECRQAGISTEQMLGCLESAETSDPEELRRASSYVEEVIDQFYPPNEEPAGFKTPWQKLDDLVRFRRSELSIWTGFSGHGKTTVLNQVILWGGAQGERSLIASLEIKPAVLLKKMTRQATALRQPDRALIRATHKWYDGKFWIFDLVGSAKTQRLFEVFDYARRRYGVSQFVVDSLLRCGIAEDDYNSQKLFADGLAEYATRHNVGVHLVAHNRKQKDDHQASGRLDVRGSASITDLGHNVYVVWRNKAKEQAIQQADTNQDIVSHKVLEQPDAIFKCDKTREGEWEGSALLWFHRDSQQYVANANDYPMPPFTLDGELDYEEL